MTCVASYALKSWCCGFSFKDWSSCCDSVNYALTLSNSAFSKPISVSNKA